MSLLNKCHTVSSQSSCSGAVGKGAKMSEAIRSDALNCVKDKS